MHVPPATHENTYVMQLSAAAERGEMVRWAARRRHMSPLERGVRRWGRRGPAASTLGSVKASSVVLSTQLNVFSAIAHVSA